MSKKNVVFVRKLLKWFELNKRDFFWRSNKLTPFQSLVAELMLQKTGASQVDKLLPGFIKKYPDAQSIVDEEEEELASILQPLGLFNRRARDLKKTAQSIVDNDNIVPNDKKRLKDLPGLGDYIANALICFTFDTPNPIVDANVARIIKRVFSFPVKGAPSRDKKLFEKMMEIIPEKNCKEFNFALLDFAALTCVPRNPKCSGCPLTEICDHHEDE